MDARRDSHCVARSYVVRLSTVLMLFWLFSLLMRFVLSAVPLLPLDAAPRPRLPVTASVAYRPPPPPMPLEPCALLLPLPDSAVPAIMVLVVSPFGAVSIMKSSSSNSEKSTGISLRVFRGELVHIAADIADALAAASALLLLLLVADADADADAAGALLVLCWW